MSHLPLSSRSADEIQDVSKHNQPVAPSEIESGTRELPPLTGQTRPPVGVQPEVEEAGKGRGEAEVTKQAKRASEEGEGEGGELEKEVDVEEDKDGMSQVLVTGEEEDTEFPRVRPKLTTSNSGADIMLGLETDEGKSAEVEIDSLESDELKPEEIPKGRVRKTSIVEKLSKSKESEMIALSIMVNAGQRQRDFEKLISEHQELVQEISRTPSAENIVQAEPGRDP